jgi:hypothetical protein
MADATRDELAALAKAAGFVAVHLRSYRERLDASIAEALEIGRHARVHFSHVKRPMLPAIEGCTGDVSPFDADFETILRWPRAMIGSDGIHAEPGPRLTETFTRVLASDLLPREELVRRMTSLPAQTLGLTDRGVIREGAAADLVLIGDRVECVVVNGVVVAEAGSMTGATPGAKLPGPQEVKKA